ncbi:haloacid dehalogenase-like hydrolase [Serratia marcescens]|uniref:haloacid dehalogenase-like hydrolase n=1 Tax=Serratia marcescens TaxID=615 RepID=UPI00065A47E2|nr:haloacid dehalogenase-like hydrolase [Serratia marcescens]KMJ16081.1 hypothetical protein SN04_00659 [Serratia marcescens]MBH3098360.1 haloacid dehalogenase-like hydrolase [Serratia marcescens]MBH3217573.1 haloacid dehalogenase-like hydrolase [Serratia marcescens]
MKSVYDLDGTLVPFNTFKVWVVLSFFISIFFLRWYFLFSIIKFALCRKIGRMDRVGFKVALLAIQQRTKFWPYVGKKYGKWLARHSLRKDLLVLGDNSTKCLATAAPDIYVSSFSQEVNDFDVTICAHFCHSGEFVETLNVVKLKFVREQFSEEPDLFFTDHYDDIPLAMAAKFTYIVSPSIKSERLFSDMLNAGRYTIV